MESWRNLSTTPEKCHLDKSLCCHWWSHVWTSRWCNSSTSWIDTWYTHCCTMPRYGNKLKQIKNCGWQCIRINEWVSHSVVGTANQKVSFDNR